MTAFTSLFTSSVRGHCIDQGQDPPMRRSEFCQPASRQLLIMRALSAPVIALTSREIGYVRSLTTEPCEGGPDTSPARAPSNTPCSTWAVPSQPPAPAGGRRIDEVALSQCHLVREDLDVKPLENRKSLGMGRVRDQHRGHHVTCGRIVLGLTTPPHDMYPIPHRRLLLLNREKASNFAADGVFATHSRSNEDGDDLRLRQRLRPTDRSRLDRDSVGGADIGGWSQPDG